MHKGLSKDFVFLFSGIVLSFALESQRGALAGLFSSDILSLLCLFLFLALTAGYLAYRHYHDILAAGGLRRGSSPRRDAYDNLRESLADGGNPAQLYAQWLEKALRFVEKCFSEKAPESPTFIQRAIGLHKSAALWTAPALDWCVLFAFIYPQAFLILGWGMTGKAGPAETTLGLSSEPNPLPRYVTMVAIAAAALSYAKCKQVLSPACRDVAGAARGFRFVLWFAVLLASSLTIDYWLNHGTGAIGGSVILTSSIVGAVAGDVLIAVISGFTGAAVGIAVLHLFGQFSAPMAAALGSVLIGFLHSWFGDPGSLWCRVRLRLRYSLLFWWAFLLGAICLSIGFARLLPHTDGWEVMGPLVLYYGLLPALNAPFLWFSVGTTRALLWLGLERKGWWPYVYALLDATIAVLVIVLLVGIIVMGVQTLDLAAVRAGAKPILPVAPLLDAVIDGFRTKSFKAEYWWIYTLMLSAMVPSLLNLGVGGFSLVRGLPVLSRYLHAQLPSGHAVAVRERSWISLVLALQMVTGVCLAIAAQFVLLPWWIFGHFLPGLGLGIFKFAQTVEALNLPGQLWP